MADPKPLAGMPLPESMASNFADAMQWMTRMWGGDPAGAARGMGVPSMMMPTMDVKELDKRITDLRTVEQWMDLNLGMLRTTIQGLEVQRHAIEWMQAAGRAATAAPAIAPAAPAPGAPATEGWPWRR